GRFSANGRQESPAFRVWYTVPVDVPKYTPAGSRSSDVMASRRISTKAFFCGRPFVRRIPRPAVVALVLLFACEYRRNHARPRTAEFSLRRSRKMGSSALLVQLGLE